MNRKIVFCIAAMMLVGGSTIFAIAMRKNSDRNSEAAPKDWGASVEEDPHAELPESLTEFKLFDQNAKVFHSNALDGKVWLGNFFFTLCTTECPIQNRKIALLMSKFEDQGLECVSITCDPGRDTPSILVDYAKQFDADPKRWHFLTDENFEYIQAVANRFFKLPLKRFTHSDQVVLFNRKGEVHGVYGVTKPGPFLELHNAIEEVMAQASGDQPAGNSEVKEDSVKQPTENANSPATVADDADADSAQELGD